MIVTFESDGRVICRDDADASRTLTIPAGTPASDRDARIAAFAGPVFPPDGGTLSDWRLALDLWGRLEDVTARVAALLASTKPEDVRLGKIARQRLEYANNVFRGDLLMLKDVAGFTVAEVDESLWRAERVRIGDLSGRWPV